MSLAVSHLCSETLEPSRTYLREVKNNRHLRYYFWRCPNVSLPDPGRILVVVHGVGRDARNQIEQFKGVARRFGYSLLAPIFDEYSYPDYQRLGRTGLGGRADDAMKIIIDDLFQQHRELTIQYKLDFFGYSGGGQFVHRFVFANPEWVRRYVITAPGWFTLPDPQQRFPYGTRATKRLPGAFFNLREIFKIPYLVTVGSLDTNRDENFRTREKIDLAQGTTRLERARTWHRKMKKASRKLTGKKSVGRIQILADVEHDFEQAIQVGKLDERVFKFLTRNIGC